MSAYESTERIIAKAQLTAETDAKDPATLTASDLASLSDGRLAELMDAGLPHLGIGARSKPKRRR